VPDWAIELARASEADIPFVMATERLPGNEGLVGRWERDEHERALADQANAYFIGSIGGKPAGFVIVEHWAPRHGGTLIRRIIVADKAQKIGRTLLSRVIDTIFAKTEASWVWLNVVPHNERGQRAYASIGFRFEDRAKYPGSGSDKSLLMILQKAEWRGGVRP
jgi:ribosomal protein S18 acetylase RimI-like enzyme